MDFKRIKLDHRIQENLAVPHLRTLNPTISRTGVKAIKKENRPIERKPFNKELPVTPYNYPLSKFTKWYAFGYKIVSGKKVYDWIEKTLPTGHAFTPDLDKVLEIKHHQIF